jgi:Flp pilus assembly protein TadG
MRNDSGQSLVEFALVVPLLILLLMGIVEFARAYNAWHIITDAGREGGRTAVIADPAVDRDSVVSVVRNALERGGLTSPDVQIDVDNFRTQTGDSTAVVISYPYRFVLLDSFMGPRVIQLSTSTVMRQE